MKSKRMGWVLIVGLVLSGFACNIGLPFAGGGPTAPCNVAASQQAYDSLINKVRAAATQRGQSVTITATEAEVTSVVARELQSSQQGAPVQFVQDPIVCFRDARMDVFGQVSPDGSNKFNALLVLLPTIANGRLQVQVDHMDVGPVSVPPQAAQSLAQIINNALNRYTSQVQLTNVRVDTGQIQLTGLVP